MVILIPTVSICKKVCISNGIWRWNLEYLQDIWMSDQFKNEKNGQYFNIRKSIQKMWTFGFQMLRFLRRGKVYFHAIRIGQINYEICQIYFCAFFYYEFYDSFIWSHSTNWLFLLEFLNLSLIRRLSSNRKCRRLSTNFRESSSFRKTATPSKNEKI